MDLGAYVQIESLKDLIENKNNIKISRVRGYRLMKFEEAFSNEELEEMAKDIFNESLDDYFATHIHKYGMILTQYNDEKKAKYTNKDGSLNWSKVHGKNRKRLKFRLKKVRKNVYDEYLLWNKYVGREDVVYIHAKIGDGNWSDTYYTDYKDEPWYLDGVVNSYDPVYVDIYAKLDILPENIENFEEKE